VLTVTFVLVGSLYLLLLLLIWALGGGRFKEYPVIGPLPTVFLAPILILCPVWTAFVAFVVLVLNLGATPLAIFLGVLAPIHIPTIIVTLTLPAWVIGQIVQRFTFLDLKVALRAMVANKARGASTLLALVIGIFTLSLLTMMVGMVTAFIGDLIADQEGGNVIILSATGSDQALQQIQDTLTESEGVNSYALITTFGSDFISLEDVSEEQTLTFGGLERRIRQTRGTAELDEFDTIQFGNIDGRQLSGNLPDVEFLDGRQLDPSLDSEADSNGAWAVVLNATQATVDARIEVGDLLTFSVGDEDQRRQIVFRIIGLVDRTEGTDLSLFTSGIYAPLPAFDGLEPNDEYVLADIDEENIPAVRRELSAIPAVFVLELSLLNDLITSVINQFTSFPILVAALALFTGGVVIANSVALSTMERRREIAIMKAVGVQRERVLGMLLLENSVMGFIGGLIGVGIGLLILVTALRLLSLGELGVSPPYGIAFALMGLCVVISLVAAVISVWGASGEKPLNVLRYD
jgi:ABC-type antimicrobial peptide transport system permease subunit